MLYRPSRIQTNVNPLPLQHYSAIKVSLKHQRSCWNHLHYVRHIPAILTLFGDNNALQREPKNKKHKKEGKRKWGGKGKFKRIPGHKVLVSWDCWDKSKQDCSLQTTLLYTIKLASSDTSRSDSYCTVKFEDYRHDLFYWQISTHTSKTENENTCMLNIKAGALSRFKSVMIGHIKCIQILLRNQTVKGDLDFAHAWKFIVSSWATWQMFSTEVDLSES